MLFGEVVNAQALYLRFKIGWELQISAGMLTDLTIPVFLPRCFFFI